MRDKKQNRCIREITFVMVISLLLLTACAPGASATEEENTSQHTQVDIETVAVDIVTDIHTETIPERDNLQRIRLAVVGDLMVHGPQLKAQLQADGSYDFHRNFDFVRPWLKGSDLVVGNLETTFAGQERGYSSFPQFNTPDAFGEALVAAGFHGVSTVNNHTIDTGSPGFFRTLSVLESLGIKTMGTKQETDHLFWEIYTINEISVGITAVTYETPRAYGRRTLNALLVPKELEGLINSFDYNNLEEDLEPVKTQIQGMKEAGADLTAVMIHWGEEYQSTHNQWQEKIANELIAAGADVIVGSHPHVLQPVRPVRREAEGSTSWVVYSLGNFISNQRFEILKRHEPEDGAILFVDIIKDLQHGQTSIETVSYQPTWVHRYSEEGKMVYEILPLVEALASPEAYHLTSEDSLHRAHNSLARTTDTWHNLPLALPKED